MPRPLNVLLVVVDSLRRQSILGGSKGAPETPFLARLSEETTTFTRAYATECWTLPSHMSMFTGLLPSEHGAHFQNMQYTGAEPTIAECLSGAGYATECITRNSLFDGSVPGALRGFRKVSAPMAPASLRDVPLQVILAAAKPRVRRLIRRSGFFHGSQKDRAEFLAQLVRMGTPADHLALAAAVQSLEIARKQRRPHFLFLNLYDVHAPYAPTETSAVAPIRSLESLREALVLPAVLPKISSHAYLRAGFSLSEQSRRALLGRYHRGVALMDRKLEEFWSELNRLGVLDDTVVIVTSDHGEAFGDHGLYLHDASIYDTHLHVPLWVHWPRVAPRRVDDVVSLASLCGLMRAASNASRRRTLLHENWRQARPAALVEHFHYPHGPILPRYRRNLQAVIGQQGKIVRAGPDVTWFDTDRDSAEIHPVAISESDLPSLVASAAPTPHSASIAESHLQIRRAA